MAGRGARRRLIRSVASRYVSTTTTEYDNIVVATVDDSGPAPGGASASATYSPAPEDPDGAGAT